jgi:hypothetical protein
MKLLTIHSIIALAVLAVAAGSASAQTYKAEIPMSFHIGDKQMAPGSYEFNADTSLSGKVVIGVRMAGHEAGALLFPIPGSDAPKAWREEGTPKLSFACHDRTCTLAAFWNGRDVSTFEFPARKPRSPEGAPLAAVTVPLTPNSTTRLRSERR